MGGEAISRDLMTRALARLGELLEQNDILLDTVTCGGTVSMLYLRSREATTDVDALFPKDKLECAKVQDLVMQVARELDLPDDDSLWFNNSIEFFGLQTRSENVVFQHGGLKLVSASWEEMLAHKLNAFRNEKDYFDAIDYLKQIPAPDPDELYSRVEKLCPFVPVVPKTQIRERFQAVWDAVHAREMTAVPKAKSQREIEEDLAWASRP